MTGDEAYFIVWGHRLAGGYYDHPPMVGWWLAALLTLGNADWWLRLPSLLLPFLLAWGAWSLLRPHSVERARLAAVLVLLQPADVWNVLITTDTPVVVLVLLSLLAYLRGMRRASTGWHAVAGLLLGAAFLGKYFAALLGVAYAAHMLLVRRDRARLGQLALLTVCALAGPAWNLWWNAEHCWTNILFNFFNRNQQAGFAWENPLLYAVSLAYLATPWLLWALWRGRHRLAETLSQEPVARALAWLAGVPLAIFFLMSFGKSIGLHWLLAFLMPLPLLAAWALPLDRLFRLCRWSAGFALLHALLAIVLLSLPLSVWQGKSLYPNIVMTMRAGAVAAKLQAPLARCGAGCTLAMEGYSSASILAHAIGRPVAVYRDGSRYGRQDDFDTDFRALDGRDFLILRKEAIDEGDYLPYFERVEYSRFTVDGANFNLIHGRGFKYDVYRDRMLTRIRDHYYRFDRLPRWLPQVACPFTGRYFPTEGAAK